MCAKPAASPLHCSYMSLKLKHQQGFTSPYMLVFTSTTIQFQCPVKTALQATTSDTRQTGTALKLCAMMELRLLGRQTVSLSLPLPDFQEKVNLV